MIARDFRATQKQLMIFSLHRRLRFGTRQVCIVTSNRFFFSTTECQVFYSLKIWCKLVKLCSGILPSGREVTQDILASLTTTLNSLLDPIEQDRCSNSLCSVTLMLKASSKIISFMFLKWQ